MGRSTGDLLDAVARTTGGGITMALKFAIQTVFEIAVVVLIIYGFCREDKLIAFEDDLKAKILNRKETKRNGKSDD